MWVFYNVWKLQYGDKTAEFVTTTLENLSTIPLTIPETMRLLVAIFFVVLAIIHPKLESIWLLYRYIFAFVSSGQRV